ncbi:uncharacterized protein LOC124943572 [Impatiens glandulifera]|uniref:uncharacterized protein LOC124943572 n=1 Tax=Impatiens glandulifera TaxID=253017 RepID=UPI001FB096D8|nr:uncharacterized protein LOC124943572 [Impatiens glandulifera]
MPRKLVFRQTSSVNKTQQPLLVGSEYSPKYAVANISGKSSRFAEVAGGTAAECAAVCCCCPCGLVDILFLAMYRVPAGLCRKALRRKRRRWLIKRGILPHRRRRCECGCDDTELQIHPFSGEISEESSSTVTDNVMSAQSDKDVVELEKEMWEHFYSGGFWRSLSRRSTSSAPAETGK